MKTHVIRGLRDCAQPAAQSLARISEATRWYPVSRSRLYREAAAGNIRFVKLGSATLVDLDSLRDYLARLPDAAIRRTSPTP